VPTQIVMRLLQIRHVRLSQGSGDPVARTAAGEDGVEVIQSPEAHGVSRPVCVEPGSLPDISCQRSAVSYQHTSGRQAVNQSDKWLLTANGY